MSVEIILNRESNIIMAEGHGRRWNFWNLSALGILLGLALFFGGMWYLLSTTNPDPGRYSHSSPSSRQKRPNRCSQPSSKRKVPAICQAALSS
jgi:hypothetical protein